MSEWIPGKGIPPRIRQTLKEMGSSPKEFLNMLNNGEGIPDNQKVNVNNTTTAKIDIDQMSDLVLQKLRKKYNKK